MNFKWLKQRHFFSFDDFFELFFVFIHFMRLKPYFIVGLTIFCFYIENTTNYQYSFKSYLLTFQVYEYRFFILIFFMNYTDIHIQRNAVENQACFVGFFVLCGIRLLLLFAVNTQNVYAIYKRKKKSFIFLILLYSCITALIQN